MLTMWTDDPVRDAEMAAYDRRPEVGRCDVCGVELHGADGIYEADEMYAFEDGGDIVCGDCLTRYCREHFRM